MTIRNGIFWENSSFLSRLESSCAAASSGLISLAQGAVTPDVADTLGIRDAMRSAAKASAEDLLSPSQPEGYLALRALLAERMRSKGIPVDPSTIVLTNGIQHTLRLLAEAMLDPGDRVLVEAPCTPSFVETFRRSGAQIVPVPVDQDGIALDQLELALAKHRPVLLCITPTFANPTGFVTSLQRRKRIIDLAMAYECFVLEDDQYSELYFQEPPPPPLISLASDVERKRVIYASSLEAVFPRVLRLGWFVADTAIIRRLTPHSRASDFVSHLPQLVVHHYLSTGRFEPTLGRIRHHYNTRATAILGILQQELSDFTVLTPSMQGGLFAWGTIPNCDTAKLLERSAPRGVIFAPGSLFYPTPTVSQHMRLSFGGLCNGQLVEGLRRIAHSIPESISIR